MYIYDFEIAGLRWQVSSILQLQELFELEPYQCVTPSMSEPDLHYRIEYLDADWTIRGAKIAGDEHACVYACGDEIHRYYFWSVFSKDRFVLVKNKKNDDRHYTIVLQPQYLQRMLPQFRLASFLSPERALLAHSGLILHASVINWQGNGILFSAPSGTGKSTQAALWAEFESAQILNGDRAVIRKQQEGFTVYGSPYAGTSGIYTTGSVPVRCIVLLSQDAENSIHRLTPREAFLCLYQQCTVHSWDPLFVESISDLLQDLASHVEVYHLACRPDQAAVELLKSKLQ